MRAIIDPYIGLVDDSPTSPNQFGEVNGGDIIGIVLVASIEIIHILIRDLNLPRNSSPPYQTGSPCEVIR